MAWRTLNPVTSQGLLAACPADASLYPRHLTRDQRPTPVPIAAVGRGSIYLWLTPETMVTLKGPETPLLPVSVLPCINHVIRLGNTENGKVELRKILMNTANHVSEWKL